MTITSSESTSIHVVNKPDKICHLGHLDIEPLVQLVERLPDHYWFNETQKRDNDYNVFRTTEHIVMRFIEERKDPRFFYDKPAWQAFSSVVLPFMHEIAERMSIRQPVFPKAMLARLQAHSEIPLHKDHGVSHKYAHKIHIPVSSDPEVSFAIGNETFYLAPGEVYEVNNLRPHSVKNNSDRARVHFIFELFETPSSGGAPKP